MADREQSHSSKPGQGEKPMPDAADKGGRTSGSKGEEHEHGVRDVGSVGRDTPDQSKERSTEIAVEAGHKGPAERRDDKR